MIFTIQWLTITFKIFAFDLLETDHLHLISQTFSWIFTLPSSFSPLVELTNLCLFSFHLFAAVVKDFQFAIFKLLEFHIFALMWGLLSIICPFVKKFHHWVKLCNFMRNTYIFEVATSVTCFLNLTFWVWDQTPIWSEKFWDLVILFLTL